MIRAGHVQRYYGKSADNPQDKDIWIDIFHVDNMVFTRGTGWKYKRDVFTFSPPGSGKRARWIKKLIPPGEDDPENPVRWIEVPVNLGLKMSSRSGHKYQGRGYIFAPHAENAGRTYSVRRVVHYDIDEGTATYVNDIGPVWRDVNDYKDQLSSPDALNYIDVEMPQGVRHRTGSGWKYDRQARFYFDHANNPLLVNPIRPDLIAKQDPDDPGDPSVIDSPNGPWRFDPLTYPVNISWTTVHIKTGIGIFKAPRTVSQNGHTGPYELLEIIEPPSQDMTNQENQDYIIFYNQRIQFWVNSGAFGTPSGDGEARSVGGGSTVDFWPTFNDQAMMLAAAADPGSDPSLAVQFFGTFSYYAGFAFGHPPGDVYVAGYYLPGETP